jgi:hypothetical protein
MVKLVERDISTVRQSLLSRSSKYTDLTEASAKSPKQRRSSVQVDQQTRSEHF